MDDIRIGIVGACGRGASFRAACEALGCVRVAAVCDINESQLADAGHRLGAAATYTDFVEMLDRSRPDAIIVGTPMHLHVPMAIAALQRGISVLSEVTAAVSLLCTRSTSLGCSIEMTSPRADRS